MQTYLIKIELASKASFVDAPCFDSLLAYCDACEQFGGQPTQGVSIETVLNFNLPLAKTGEIWHGSRMFWGENIESTTQWFKRWDTVNDDLADFGKKKARVEIGKGEFKSYKVDMILHSFSTCWFYFESSDVERVDFLLRTWLRGIGKKISQGYGLIKSYAIEEVKGVNFTDYLLRPVPVDIATPHQLANSVQAGFNVAQAYCAYKPPYWLPENFAKCWTLK